MATRFSDMSSNGSLTEAVSWKWKDKSKVKWVQERMGGKKLSFSQTALSRGFKKSLPVEESYIMSSA